MRSRLVEPPSSACIDRTWRAARGVKVIIVTQRKTGESAVKRRYSKFHAEFHQSSCQSSAPHLFSHPVASIKHIFNELHYEMVRKVAEGGMGVVYEAHQLGAGNFRKVV